MNFTDSPFEKMMQTPRVGNDGGNPCDGCHISNYCKGKPSQCKKRFRALIVKPSRASEKGNPTKSQDFVGRGGAAERADFGPCWPEVPERSLQRRGPKS